MGDDADIDAALADLGLSGAPPTREEELYILLTDGKYKKIDSCRYWLSGEMARFYSMVNKENVKVGREVVQDGKVVLKLMSKMEYGKLSLRYYLKMYHLPYFERLDNRKEPANLDKMVDLLVDYPPIRDTINKDY
jgi:hypothetical protein